MVISLAGHDPPSFPARGMMCWSQQYDDTSRWNVRRRGSLTIGRAVSSSWKGQMRPREAGGTMSTRSGPGHGGPDPALDIVISERRQLINLAYRLLGSLAEAEDAVQEAYARWYAMPADQRDAIASPGAWLTTVTSRICLDLLGSARARREHYVGEWIPEPAE